MASNKKENNQDKQKKAHNFESDEKLAGSPDCWPEIFPGITKYIAEGLTATVKTNFENSDVVMINSLGCLAPGLFVDELQAITSIAIKLDLEQEQEIARGKILQVLL